MEARICDHATVRATEPDVDQVSSRVPSSAVCFPAVCRGQALKRRLEMFQNRCLLRMKCSVIPWQMKQYHLSEAELKSRVSEIQRDSSLSTLAWITLGSDACQIDFERLPRNLLNSWVDHPRRRCRPPFHYGHGPARGLTRGRRRHAISSGGPSSFHSLSAHKVFREPFGSRSLHLPPPGEEICSPSLRA